jgi:ABC-type glycerol-3-phosphate transport system substrate-binding protein
MKKFSMILFAAAMTVAFAACSGGKKEETKAQEQPAATAPAPADSTKVAEVPQEEDPATALKAFIAYAKEYAEAHNNIAKDPNKYTKLARQSQQKVADMERLKEKFTKKQVEEYQKALDVIKKVNTAGK